ncbi:ATP phosphoribosyltransferase regulatory subunit [Kallotenue papyrolyticum]|uniref:ATP phosphoribosyltransferase regulatory subunit n=1 Tax=Kallotenue papyrolyticum TaxID=1325125 RepID=UPI0004AD910B|nr:ATP phosphoribosyltransferase regulatory subunit [Kallotenue papyrolyticum]
MVEPVRGMHDVLPAQRSALKRIQTLLEATIERWGYQFLDLPILEHREMYLKKAGEELVGKLYDFEFHGRHLALRPEWTASVLRAYVHGLQSEPLPARLAYSGPVFRYERPQRMTYRQFTQVGVELIGGLPPLADAEVVALACRGLEAVGVRDYRLTVGHIGVVRALLGNLGLAERTANLLLWNLERLRAGQVELIRRQLAEAHGDELFDLGPLAALPDDQLEALLLTMLRAVGLRLDNSTRPPEAIVARLVRKLRRDDPQPRVERALELLSRLAATVGPPEDALPQLEALFAAEGIDPAPINELRAILELLAAQGVPLAHLTVNAGLGRGLHYYTGLIFEIYDADGLQLCGGGRYDDLVAAIGGRASVPAVGFAYGLERVTHAAPPAAPATLPLVLVMAAAPEHRAAALQTALRLREHGYAALVDTRDRSLSANLRDAARRGAQAVIICDARAPEVVRWHRLADHRERELAQADWPDGGDYEHATVQ